MRQRRFVKISVLVAQEEPGKKVWYRGFGPDPYCYVAEQATEAAWKGTSWVAESAADLEKASKILGASPIHPIPGYGGGQRVTLTDPYGFTVHIIHGQDPAKRVKCPEKMTLNFPGDEKDRKNAFQRFTLGPALVHKLGHYGCIVPNYASGKEWYTKNFNLIASDVFEVTPEGEAALATDSQATATESGKPTHEIQAFFRLDRGKEFVDHHCFFLLQGPPHVRKIHHSSYEVLDFDQQLIGHEWLTSKGYRPSWGVGRHVLGSQIFDYWFDSSGHHVEHYADGDVLNDEVPTGHHQVGANGMPTKADLAVWGPELTPAFLMGEVNPQMPPIGEVSS